MVCIAADKNEKAARAVNLPTIKTVRSLNGAMKSFGVMRKAMSFNLE